MPQMLRGTFAIVGLLAACSPALPQGQFGPYSRQSKHLILPRAETLKVYRVKYWAFTSGEPPAIQLEYEPPFSVSDSAAIRREARLLWPFFVPYLEAHNVTGGIITATNLHISGVWPIAWTSHNESFGVVADKSTDGHWRFKNDTVSLPAADPSRVPHITGIDGRPLPFTFTYPAPPAR